MAFPSQKTETTKFGRGCGPSALRCNPSPCHASCGSTRPRQAGKFGNPETLTGMPRDLDRTYCHP